MVNVNSKNFKTEYERLIKSMPSLNQTEEELWKGTKRITLDK